jgi:uncharacterized membrane protein
MEPLDKSRANRDRAPGRVSSVDALRGIVLLLMALDHTRGFFHRDVVQGLAAHDLAHTSAAAFTARFLGWTCAPLFSLLAGAGAFLAGARGKPKAALSWFLATRGLLLIALELTVVQWSWTFRLDPVHPWGLALWALGWSMLCLAALVHLPARASLFFGGALIAGHGLLDGLAPERFGVWAPLWTLLHAPGMIALGGDSTFLVHYPLIPWVGVMAAGYGLGPLLLRPAPEQRRALLALGLGLCGLFVLLRLANGYGDPLPWAPQATHAETLLAFFDCQRQPPSLCHLSMTLGPGLLLLGFLATAARLPRPLLTLGRAPLSFYLLHLPLIHAVAFAVNLALYGHGDFSGPGTPDTPPEAGFSLGVVLLVWLCVVAALLPACASFERWKRTRGGWLAWL